MAGIPNERTGEPIESKGAALEFSCYPTIKTARRDKQQTKVFTTYPWSIIHSITRRLSQPR